MDPIAEIPENGKLHVLTLGKCQNIKITFASLNYIGKTSFSKVKLRKTEKIYKYQQTQKIGQKRSSNFSSIFKGVLGVQIELRIDHWKSCLV